MSASLQILIAVAIVGTPLDSARDQDPRLEGNDDVKTVARFDPRLKGLWLDALARPEADLQRQAAEAIARAQALGMPGLADAVPRLLTLLEGDTHPVVRLAAARALVALDARQAAPLLTRRSGSDGFDMARVLEPALARWDHAPMRPVWLARLNEPQTARGPLLLAIEAAAVVKLPGAAPPLRRLVVDGSQPGDVRLEAARALALLQPAGLEKDAAALAAEGDKVLERVLAATLLAQQRGADAEAMLLVLAGDREPAVASLAAQRLVGIAPEKLGELAPRLADSADAGLRLLGARALVEVQTPEAVQRLGTLLDDPHRGVRSSAREAIAQLGAAEALAEPARAAVRRALTAGGPHALEQAAQAAGTLKHAQAADRLVPLVAHADHEVRVAAAWALRRLALPATAPAILEHARRLSDKPPSAPSRPVLPAEEDEVVDDLRHLEHLIESLGVLRHRPALSFLSRYLPMPPQPRPPVDNPLWRTPQRSAAIWALGQIAEAAPPADLVAILQRRLSGEPNKEPGATGKRQDEEPVRVQAAVSLGRMKVKEAGPELRRIYEDEKEPPSLRRACHWALARIAGEPLPPLTIPARVREVWHTGWFLEPAR